MDVFDTGYFSRVRLRVLVALPGLQVFIGLAQEKDFTVLVIRRVGKQEQNTLLLLNAAQVKQIGIGLHR